MTTTRRVAQGNQRRPHPVSIAVALADKLDQLAGFFDIGESRLDLAIHSRCAAPRWA